jgi:diaminopimelate epimerase
MEQKKTPIHKFNGGIGATLCIECNKIISEGMTEDLYCDECNFKYKLIRSDGLQRKGMHLTFVEWNDNELFLRTYERGVENETFSCGTGVTASALIAGIEKLGEQRINIETLGGKLAVSFNNRGDNIFDNIYLMGPGTFVFSGALDI